MNAERRCGVCKVRRVFLFDGKSVCATFLVKAFRFSRDLQSSIRAADGEETNMSTRDRVAPKDNSSVRKDAIITSLERLADNTADVMPDSGEQHLPFFRKEDVYEHFVKEYRLLYDDTPPSKCYFTSTWKHSCAKIKVRRVSRFTKCSLCEELRSALKQAVTQGTSTEELRSRKSAHNDMVSRERREYKKKGTCQYWNQRSTAQLS